MKLYSTVFITGFTILFLEIIGSRLISPVYGNTIFVWSSLIGVTIASLALGYYLGGKFSQNNPNRIGYPIIIGVMWIPLLLIFKEVLPMTTFMGVQLGSLASSVILLAFPLTLLGMVTPVLIQLSKKEKGLASGNIFAVGTIGSFFGAIITGFILIPNVPISYMLVTVPVFSMLIGGYWLSKQKSIIPVSITVSPYAIIVLISLMMVVPSAEAVIFETESLYGNIKVYDGFGNNRLLLVDNSLQSIVEKDGWTSNVPFASHMEFAYFINPSIDDALVLGLGSGALSEKLENELGATVTNIEIDQKIDEIAREYFNYDGTTIISDARYFMKTTDQKFDLILYDLARGDSFPIHLYTTEAFYDAKQILNPNGVLVIHLDGLIDSKKINSIFKTLENNFDNVILLNGGDSMLSAKVFFATDKNLNIIDIENQINLSRHSNGMKHTYDNILQNKMIYEVNSGTILSDDYNPMDILQLESSIAWRESSWGMLNE